jgi:hypothetical protein
MLERKGVSKSYEQSLTLSPGLGESVTPLRTRIAAAIESSGFRITIFDNRTRGTNRGQARRKHRLALGSVGCDGIVPRVMGTPRQSLIRPTGSKGGFVHSAFTDP